MPDTPERPRVLTGLRANSNLTLANYLGAMHPMAQLTAKHKNTHDFFMFVPDLHSFTTPADHNQLYGNTLQNVKTYIATGAIDLKNTHTHVYRQSHVPAHSELAWILDCFTYMGELGRMTQFKDKAGLVLDEEHEEQLLKTLMRRTRRFSNRLIKTLFEQDLKKVMQQLKHESISVGLFNYPVLMAADILLYGATYVPLGDDQRQHVELTRDVGLRINEKFKDIYADGVFAVVPLEWKKQLAFSGLNQGLRIRSLRNQSKKMSKSDADSAGYISLSDSAAKATKKIMAATTDSEGAIRFDWQRQPGITNLLQMLAMLTNKDLLQVVTEWQGRTGYGELKQATAKAVAEFLTGFQERLSTISDEAIIKRLEADEARARKISGAQLLRVQQAVGLRPRP